MQSEIVQCSNIKEEIIALIQVGGLLHKGFMHLNI